MSRCTSRTPDTSSTDRGSPHQSANTINETKQVAGAVAFAAGALIAVQGRINGELGSVTGDGVLAAVVNFSVGLIVLLAYVFVRKNPRRALLTLPQTVRSELVPWWALSGGLAGAAFVAAQGTTVGALGVALFTVATVAGQTGMSLAVDRWGLGPTGVVPVSTLRTLAAVLATLAVAVAAAGKQSESGGHAAEFVALALFAGAAVAFQAAFNGRVSVGTGQPTVAATVNFTVGLVALVGVLVVERSLRADVTGSLFGSLFGSLPSLVDRPWLYSGGLMGLIFVVSAAWSVRALGVLLFTLVVISGSLAGAVLVDLIAPTSGTAFNWELVVGVLMMFGAVALAGYHRQARAPWQDSVS